jgi:hypothetical protein
MGIILTLILVCCVFFTFGQTPLPPPPPDEGAERPVTLSLLSNYYDQDGEHGAVNGGIGAQKLESYSQEAHIYIPVKELSGLSFNAGADHFTSASLRLIDKYKTAASAAQGDVSGDETRVYSSLGYDFGNKPKHSVTSIGIGYSKEYDVNSYSLNLGWNKEIPAKNLTYHFGLSGVADRWLVIYPGEFRNQILGTSEEGGSSGGSGGNSGGNTGSGGSGSSGKPTGSGSDTDGQSGASTVDSSYGQVPVGYATPLPVTGNTATKNGKTYPVDWRYSLNITNKLSYVINSRMNGAVGLDLTYQSGLLSTPFYRVYFNDGITNELDKEVRIEKLPRQRYRGAVYARYDYHFSSIAAIRTMARYYIDNWNVSGITASIEVPVKLSGFLSVSPFYRISIQNGSKYFAGYGEHVYKPGGYYTSDYDLSSFNAHKAGTTLRVSPLKPIVGVKNEAGSDYLFGLSSIGMRYAYYWRSDGFRSHSFSLELNVNF